jgi:glycerophosphoryl diester phosphodiesterase
MVLKKKTMFQIMLMAAGLAFTVLESHAAAGMHPVLTLAHRGASGYAPENTIVAFDKAVKMNADFLEMDVQQSKDGQLVIIHDTTVDRTTDGFGPVKDLTFAQLRALDAGSWFSPEFADVRIPTLTEVLDRYQGKIGMLIEIKSPSRYPGIERKVANELKKRKMHLSKNRKVIVQSFDHASVRRFHRLLPAIPAGVLTDRAQDVTTDKLKEYAVYADYVNPSLHLITKPLVNNIHSLDMKLFAWTVRDAKFVEPLIEKGVDGIITDYPDYVSRKMKTADMHKMVPITSP